MVHLGANKPNTECIQKRKCSQVWLCCQRMIRMTEAFACAHAGGVLGSTSWARGRAREAAGKRACQLAERGGQHSSDSRRAGACPCAYVFVQTYQDVPMFAKTVDACMHMHRRHVLSIPSTHHGTQGLALYMRNGMYSQTWCGTISTDGHI